MPKLGGGLPVAPTGCNESLRGESVGALSGTPGCNRLLRGEACRCFWVAMELIAVKNVAGFPATLPFCNVPVFGRGICAISWHVSIAAGLQVYYFVPLRLDP